MIAAVLSREEVALRGKALYEQTIRRQVEAPENIGRMVIIDIESGDYEVDDVGIVSAERLHAKHPQARLYGIRIGYNVAEALGGVMERTGHDCRPSHKLSCAHSGHIPACRPARLGN